MPRGKITYACDLCRGPGAHSYSLTRAGNKPDGLPTSYSYGFVRLCDDCLTSIAHPPHTGIRSRKAS